MCAPELNSAWVNILNVSTGHRTSVAIDAPEGYTSEGDSAEWIVEPGGPSVTPFAPITFTDCWSGTPNNVADLTNAFDQDVLAASGAVLIDGQIADQGSVKVSWTGGP